MPSKPLLSKPVLLTNRKWVERPLPIRVADLEGCELTVHCDSCGRHLRLHPGIADFHPNTHLARLLQRLTCAARRNGRACGGRPRRLILLRDDRQWTLEAAGEWQEDDSAYWEESDFEMVAEPRHREAA